MSDEKEVFKAKLKNLTRHISNVRENCLLLGERLIDMGEQDFALHLIANGHIHDHSKFFGIEWEYLNPHAFEHNKVEADCAIKQHITTNFHHPEAWGGIENMPRIYLAEMVCDWAARSQEFGGDVREWVKDKATKKFNFNSKGKVYKEIKFFLDLLLDPGFK